MSTKTIYSYTMPQATLTAMTCGTCHKQLVPHTDRGLINYDRQGAYVLCPYCGSKHYAPASGSQPATFHGHGDRDGTNTQRWCGIDGAYVKAGALTAHCPRCHTRFDAVLIYVGGQLVPVHRWSGP